jgi:hypothetical protein
MSTQQRAKRPRTHQPDAAPAQVQRPGRDQLLLKSPELQSRLGQRYCDESELLPLLLSHGLVGRVRTIEVAVHPLGGDNFKIRLDATKPSVGEAKAEIARVQGTEEARQELYKVAVRADGGAVREDDADAEPLNEDDMFLGDGEVVAMAVKELPPLVDSESEARSCVSNSDSESEARSCMSDSDSESEARSCISGLPDSESEARSCISYLD